MKIQLDIQISEFSLVLLRRWSFVTIFEHTYVLTNILINPFKTIKFLIVVTNSKNILFKNQNISQYDMK